VLSALNLNPPAFSWWLFSSSIKGLVDELRMDNHFWVSEAMYQKVMSLSKE
jgi:hypothetical protein